MEQKSVLRGGRLQFRRYLPGVLNLPHVEKTDGAVQVQRGVVLRRRLLLVQLCVYFVRHVLLSVVEVAVCQPEVCVDTLRNGLGFLLKVQQRNRTHKVSSVYKVH